MTKNCEHPLKRRERISLGMYRCVKCDTMLDPNRSTHLRISERVTLDQGDIVRAQGIGLAKFAYVDLESTGALIAWVMPLDAGKPNGFRAIRPERLRRASKRTVAR